MTAYEIIFQTESLDESVIDSIYNTFEALVSDHAGLTRLTLTASGVSVMDATQAAVTQLLHLGVHVKHVTEDLVTRRDIADRLQMSSQGVGLWVRGERHADDPFPDPCHAVAGGIWLWGDVVAWLRRQSIPVDEGIEFPSRADHARISAWLMGMDLAPAS